MAEIKQIGKKVIDISKLIDVFEAQEGEIQQIIGKTGNGKTYEGTRRAWGYLTSGYTVYTTWRMILPDYYDERENKFVVFMKTLFFKKQFYKFDLKKNWHFIDIDRPDLVEFLAGLTDCIVFLDEGQDIFDSYEGVGMAQIKRRSLTRTRHLRKTLIVISQRASAVHVTARANVTFFYKAVKTRAWWFPFKPYFKVYRTEEVDTGMLPVWEDSINDWQAELWHSHFARQYIYEMYNSWYLRAGIPKSQTVAFEAYNLNQFEKLVLLFMRKPKQETMSKQELLRIEGENAEKFKALTTVELKGVKVKKTLKDALPIDKKVLELKHEITPDTEVKKTIEIPQVKSTPRKKVLIKSI